MCQKPPLSLLPVMQALPQPIAVVARPGAVPGTATGSRRRRLWELPTAAHCPVVGVCLPMPALRRLAEKLGGVPAGTDDYALHCTAVSEGKRRGPWAEALQQELDRRYAAPLREAAACKTPEALADWWQRMGASGRLGAALWAVMTHPRCTPLFEDQVLGEVHMLQHQVGMATRVEAARFEALIDENAVLARELAAAQQRSMRQAAGQAARAEALQAQLVQAHGERIRAETEAQATRERLATLEAAAPQLATRWTLARELEAMTQRAQAAERDALAARQEAERQARRAARAEETLSMREAASAAAPTPDDDALPAAPRLADKAVLCVGGRTASVPVYRRLVEDRGARFLHHDGGEEQGAAQLDATLAAADLVICQTGCISHDAYWRVKDHCKRTGKRCVFVESPSGSGFQRALAVIQD